MKEREELDLILKLIKRYNLPLSPILEYSIKEKARLFPEEESPIDSFIADNSNHDSNQDAFSEEDYIPQSYDVRWFCLSILSCIEEQFDKRKYQILQDILKGESRRIIAEKHKLTQERVRQIVVKATKDARELITGQLKRLDDTIEENSKLKFQITLLKEQVNDLKAKCIEDMMNLENYGEEKLNINSNVANLMETPILNLNLPVRAIKTLIALGVEKFADIPQIESEMKISNIRNSGRKTVFVIIEMLESFHLSFGMSLSKIIETLHTNDWKSAKYRWIK